MKGQLSLEYLVLSVIGLAVLAIAVFTLASIKNDSDKALELLKLKSDATAVFNAAQDVCAMGDGNSREIRLIGELIIESDGESLGFSKKEINQTLIFKTRCESQMEGELKGVVIVFNEYGTINAR